MLKMRIVLDLIDRFIRLMKEGITPGTSFNIHIFFFETSVQINLSHIREECKNKKKTESFFKKHIRPK